MAQSALAVGQVWKRALCWNMVQALSIKPKPWPRLIALSWRLELNASSRSIAVRPPCPSPFCSQHPLLQAKSRNLARKEMEPCRQFRTMSQFPEV